MKRCAHCNSMLGFITHRHWSQRFCSLAHKKAYLHRLQQHKRQQEEHRAIGYLQRLNAKPQRPLPGDHARGDPPPIGPAGTTPGIGRICPSS